MGTESQEKPGPSQPPDGEPWWGRSDVSGPDATFSCLSGLLAVVGGWNAWAASEFLGLVSALGPAVLLAGSAAWMRFARGGRRALGSLLLAAASIGMAVLGTAILPIPLPARQAAKFVVGEIAVSGMFALGALGLTHLLRPSVELRRSVIGATALYGATYVLRLAAAGAFPIRVGPDAPLLGVAGMLAFLAWRATVLERRDAW